MSEHEIFVREFPVEFAETGDGRTIDARIVPYNVPARVADPPDFTPYEETFLPGAFERQTRAADRVKIWLNFEHEQGIRGIVGHGIELHDRADGLYGSFRVHDNPDGEKALALVREGLLTGLSLEFAALRSRVVEGVTQRLRAHIDKVSLCRTPAFADARVLALREAQEEADAEAPAEEPPAEEPEPEADEAAAEEAVEEPVALAGALRQQPDVVKATRRITREEAGTLQNEWKAAAQEPDIVSEMLKRVGYEPLMSRAIVRRPWDGSASRFEDEEWRRSCILDRGDQFDTAKTRYAFPVLEPNGDLNVNGMHAAAGRLNQAQAPPAARAAAARRLLRYYTQAGETPPPALRAMAGR